MVFGKLKGYDWWPGLIITFKEAMQRPSLENCYWVRWFGDHKVSEVCIFIARSLKYVRISSLQIVILEF